jgi:hypothetical protein
MTRPESFPKLFYVYSQGTSTSSAGRILQEAPAKKAELRCTLSIAKPDEVERFRQDKVVVTHTIFHRGAPQAKENDVFKLIKNGVETRSFRVKAIHNKGEMDIETTYYCEERGDAKSC